MATRIGATKTIPSQMKQETSKTTNRQQSEQIIRNLLYKYPSGHETSQRELKQLIKLHRTHESAPELSTIDPQHQAIISQMLPQYPEKHTTEPEQTTHEIQCKTCQRTFRTYKGRKQHQKHADTCDIQGKPLKIHYLCPNRMPPAI